MPRIPLYNKGQGPAAQLATGRLSPRADVGAFTAPGQAVARLGGAASDIAFQFGMAERNSQDRRVRKEERVSADGFFSDKVLRDQSTDTEAAKANMKQYREEYLEKLNVKGYSKRRMRLVREEIDSVFGSRNIEAQQNAFKRHVKLATDVDNEAIEINLQALKTFAPGTPEHDRALANNANIFANAREEGRQLSKTPERVEQEAILGRAQSRFNAAKTVDEVNDIFAELAANKTIDPTKISTAQKIKNQKTKEILDDIESTFNFALSEAETVEQAEELTKEFNDNPSVTNRRRARANANLSSTISRIENSNAETALELITENDFTSGSLTLAASAAKSGESVAVETASGDFITLDFSEVGVNNQITLKNNIDALNSKKDSEKADALIDSLMTAYSTGNLNKMNTTAQALVTSEADEALVEQTLYNAAYRISNNAEAALKEGNIEVAEEVLRGSNELLTQQYGGKPSLSNQGGTIGNQAVALRNANATIQASINSRKAEAKRISVVETSINNGSIISSKHLFKPDELKRATENVLADKETLNEKFAVLANNDLSSDEISATVTRSYGFLVNPSADVESEQFIKTAEASYTLYQNMNQFGAGLVNNHTTPDERLFFNSVETFVKSGGLDITQAVRNVAMSMRREYTLDETSKFNKEITTNLTGLIDEKSNIYWWGNKEIRNEDYIKTEMINLATLYRKMDLNIKDSIKLAKESVGSTHMNLNGVFMLRDKNYPPNIEQLVQLAAVSFAEANSTEDMEIDVADVYLYPVPYQTGEFMVVYGNVGAPSSEFTQTTWDLADLIELGQKDLEAYKKKIKDNQAITSQNLQQVDSILENLANETLYDEIKTPYGSDLGAFAFDLEMQEMAKSEQEAQ